MRNRFMRRAVVCILALAMMLSFDGVSTIASAAKAKAKAPKISSKSIVVKVGSSKKVTIKNKPKKAKVTWKSKNKKIAKVSKSGKIKGMKAGKTTVTATVKYKKGKKTEKFVQGIYRTGLHDDLKIPLVGATPARIRMPHRNSHPRSPGWW